MKLYKVKCYDIIFFLVFFSLIKIQILPDTIRQIFKIVSIGFSLLFFFSNNYKNIINKTLILPAIMVLPSIISFFSNQNIRLLLEGILNASCICLISTSINYSVNKGLINHFIDLFYKFTLISCILSILSILLIGKANNNSGAEIIYIFGNKFATNYLFILLIGLAYKHFFNEEKLKIERPIILVAFSITALAVSFWTKCYTALVSFLVMLLLILFTSKKNKIIRKLIDNPLIAILLVILPGIIAYNIKAILNLPLLKTIVTEWFGKSIGLTGRAYIYSTFQMIYKNHPIIGYGYNSDIVYKITGVGNAQNGIMDLLINYGIIGVFVVLTIVYFSFKNSKNKDSYWGLKISFVVLCVCSVVEISFNYIFFLIIFLLYYTRVKNRG